MGFLATAGKTAVKTAAKVGFKIKKVSPEILLGTGVACTIVGVVVAVKETKKATEVKEKLDRNLEAIDILVEEDPAYTQEMMEHDLSEVKKQAMVSYVKVYAPVVLIEGMAIACFLGSYGILKKRSLVLMAAYTALDDQFKKYRERVRGLVGEDPEKMIFSGAEFDNDAPPFDILDKNGNVVDQKKIPVMRDSASVCFDQMNSCYFKRNPFENKSFLERTQAYANDYLHLHGHLFLNTVYEWLGFPHTPQGAVCGWLASENGGHDGYVDFGLMDVWREKVADFQHGYEPAIWLNFNHDGPIWDKI